MVDETGVVLKMMSGFYSEEDVLCEFGLTYAKVDEIMHSHGYFKCSKCRNWHNSNDPLCNECQLENND